MRFHSEAAIYGGLLLSSVADAQSVQQNNTICNWARLRAGVVRDAAYLDGGLLWRQAAFVDGSTPVVSSDGNAAGDMFRLNFSIPYDTRTSNLSALLERMSKAGGAGNNIAPNYVDGTMLTNDGELYLYGGLPRLTNSQSPQSSDTVLGYETNQYGVFRQSWSPGFYQGTLSAGVNRYITNGAGVSAPSENLGFYFSGMRAPGWGPIYYENSSANQTANTMVTVDMSTMRSETWTNSTLPGFITPRADAEIVWVPVGKNGVLVAIGGVTAPEEIWATGLNSSQTSQSRAQSPGFMTTLSVYDISTKQWYLQNTTGDAPGQLTEFCAVVATANDSSSHNVYIYGGYDGLNANNVPSDDVWILSIPAFIWVKAYTGAPSHGRSGHRCVKPYPDQMLVLGGIHQNQAQCVEGGIVQIFNLNTLKFQDTYDPAIWSEYQIPSIVSSVIGGNSKGGATKVAAWSNNSLASVFTTRYSTTVARYYPYTRSSAPSQSTSSGQSGLSTGALVAIIVVIVVLVIALLVLLLLFLRRRKQQRQHSRISSSDTHSLSASEAQTESTQGRISRWLHGTSPRAGQTKTSDPPSSSTPDVQQVNSYASLIHRGVTSPPQRHEIGGTERLMPPFELATPYNSDNLDQYHDRRHHNDDNNEDRDTSNSSSAIDWVDRHQYPMKPTLGGRASEIESAYDPVPAAPRRDAPVDVDEDALTRPSSSSNSTNAASWPFPARSMVLSQPNQQPISPLHPEQMHSYKPAHQRFDSKVSSASNSSGLETLPSPMPPHSFIRGQEDRLHHRNGDLMEYGPISPVSAGRTKAS